MGTFVYLSHFSQGYGHWNVKNGSFYVFSVDDSKKTVWIKYFSASERYYLNHLGFFLGSIKNEPFLTLIII